MEKQIIGYLVKKDGEVIGATGNKEEAMYIAEEYEGICYKVITTVRPNEDPITKHILCI